ncbi:adenine phosphoribosyltransferase, putative [Pediculus humanus corporis]|uniref:adenine phosphoribosyltransferase n=1 Tax=Pediculus humanus subsp. corporis TaxID=121224 RepID=E0VAJ4_PEDHC|nr:adenine phosphoribosyltransferase, putative [Pediculus humanus corporis]EEB10400.1 adenine phosphoribosyltransferase, putative [Pediculus humanus corporis]
MNNPQGIQDLCDLLKEHSSKYVSKVQAVCAIKSRGFLFGPLIALQLQVPFIPIRKKGKLPGEVIELSFDMEYGSATLEIQKNSIPPGSNVLIVDDLLATGSTLEAGCMLIKNLGANVYHCVVIIELEEFNGKSKVPCPVHSFIKL